MITFATANAGKYSSRDFSQYSIVAHGRSERGKRVPDLSKYAGAELTTMHNAFKWLVQVPVLWCRGAQMAAVEASSCGDLSENRMPVHVESSSVSCTSAAVPTDLEPACLDYHSHKQRVRLERSC